MACVARFAFVNFFSSGGERIEYGNNNRRGKRTGRPFWLKWFAHELLGRGVLPRHLRELSLATHSPMLAALHSLFFLG